MKETIFSQKIQDEYFMNIALSLAKRGIGRTSPNPMVGCVIVKNNEILSYGWHKCYGGHHAEVNAVKKLTTSQLKGSTVYVTLEPCSHYGKTPPCATLLVEKKVGRVVIAMVDPNPKVNNRGIGILRTAGIQVDIGICEEAAKKLNKGFIKRIQENKPWVTVKIASSLDGNIALKNGESKWITSAVSREKVHQFRSENDAIITGIGTIISDDPEYTVRHSDGNSPCLIILDRKFVIPEDAKVLTNTTRKIVIFVDNTVDPIKIDRFLKN